MSPRDRLQISSKEDMCSHEGCQGKHHDRASLSMSGSLHKWGQLCSRANTTASLSAPASTFHQGFIGCLNLHRLLMKHRLRTKAQAKICSRKSRICGACQS